MLKQTKYKKNNLVKCIISLNEEILRYIYLMATQWCVQNSLHLINIKIVFNRILY